MTPSEIKSLIFSKTDHPLRKLLDLCFPICLILPLTALMEVMHRNKCDYAERSFSSFNFWSAQIAEHRFCKKTSELYFFFFSIFEEYCSDMLWYKTI